MKIYNTLAREKQELVPGIPGEIRIYACGPTVYNYIHIGNARPLCVFDVLRRYLEWRGYKVIFAQNFTDIDDKLIKKANDEGISVSEVASRFVDEFWTDSDGLNIRRATINPKATENIDEIISLINDLVAKGCAYQSGGDVYFRTSGYSEYGKLSRQPLEDLESGARIGVSEIKENPLDFTLWKSAKPGEPYWESPFGNGRPGWHIECSAMARRFLGKTIDIHCGGQDLIFPHHENEIAQSECANGTPFARYWMHNGYINVDNRKMSKSLGNFFTVRDVAKEYGYEPVRYLMISAHYRSPINYSPEITEQCKNALERMYNCLDSLEYVSNSAVTAGEDISETLGAYKQKFIDALEDDLNTADAISVIFEMVRECNILVRESRLDASGASSALGLFAELLDVLGLGYREKSSGISAEIEAIIEQRAQARTERNFALADELRDRLKSMGVTLEDTPGGVKWHIE